MTETIRQFPCAVTAAAYDGGGAGWLGFADGSVARIDRDGAVDQW